jgi:hypothetical protein
MRLLFSCVLLLALPAFAAEEGAGGVQSAYAELEAAGMTDGQAWFDLAAEAREDGNLPVASKALSQAESLQFSAARIALERARINIAAGDPDAAIEQLQGLADNGFTAVTLLSGDPVIHSLAGDARYDAMIAAMTVAAFPCEHHDGFRDFDFWIGEWVVHTSNGQLAGHNSITRDQKGCVLLENWQSATGGSGMSINYLDTASNEWVQIWNDASGSQINIRGNVGDDGMLLEGQIHYVSNGTTAPFRGLWTPLPDGRVRQYFEQSNDGGETWQPWFEGFYSRTDLKD